MVRIRFVVLAAALASACGYDATFKDCTIVCALDGDACPDGTTCGAEGLCRTGQGSGTCVLASDGTGGTITHVGGKTIHTFDTNQSGSTFTPPAENTSGLELLVVAGGGGGGSTRGGGGGGGGGLVHVMNYGIDQTSYVVMVGYGGGAATNGGNSSFDTIVAIGGGAGRPSAMPNGGCGGGASHDTNDGPAGTGSGGQGNAGGSVGYNSGSNIFTGAGGGGAGGAGGNGTVSAGGGGGPGLASSISGALLYYASGGGGGDEETGSDGLSPGMGGNGGGGNGGLNAIGSDGVDGTGGGGGGGGNFLAGGRGGDGVVIISYPMAR